MTTLLKSLPMLFDVVILCAFAFFIFGIVGVFCFKGALRYRCMEAVPFVEQESGEVGANYILPDGDDS